MIKYFMLLLLLSCGRIDYNKQVLKVKDTLSIKYIYRKASGNIRLDSFYIEINNFQNALENFEFYHKDSLLLKIKCEYDEIAEYCLDNNNNLGNFTILKDSGISEITFVYKNISYPIKLNQEYDFIMLSTDKNNKVLEVDCLGGYDIYNNEAY